MPHKVASVILINEKNQILLQLRDNKEGISYPNYWGTIGGHCEKGENPLDALKREVKEEICLEFEDYEFLGSFDDGAGNTAYIYKAQIRKKVKEISLTEGQKLKYFSIPEIMNLHTPEPFKKFLRKNKDIILKNNSL